MYNYSLLYYTKKGGFILKKRIISIILLLAMAASLSTAAFADGFPDLEKHWAKTSMENLVARGLLSGYDDGTMRPDNNITAIETLAFLSRFYAPSDEVMEKIRADYLDTVKEIDSRDWASDSLCICLAAGILSSSQMKELKLGEDKPIEKQLLSAYLVRAIQEETKANSMADTKLPFGDVNDISKDYIGHIAMLYDAKIVQGNDKNNYDPKGGVTRAIVATMVSNALAYIENLGVTLTVPGYEEEDPTPPPKPGTRYSGVITEADTGYVVLRDFKGVARRFSLSEVTVNDSPALMTASLIGCYATLIKPDDSASCSINVTLDGSTVYVQGSIASTGTSTKGGIVSERFVNVTSPETGKTSKYTMDNNTTKYIVGGDTATFSVLGKGQFVTIKLVQGIPSEVYAESGSYELTGAVSALDFNTNIFEINTEDGNTVRFRLNPNSLPAVTRGPHNVSINLLTIGSPVNLNVRDGLLTTIALAGEFKTIRGTLYATTTTLNGTTWIVEDNYGAKHTLTLDGSAPVYNGTEEIALSEIKVGDNLSVDAYAGTVVEIRLEHSTGTVQLNGSIRTVNANERSLTLLKDNKIITVDCSGVSNVVDLATGKNLSLSLLTAGNNITVYGEYVTSDSFKASGNILVNP